MSDDVIARHETPVQWRERMDRRERLLKADRDSVAELAKRENRIEALRAASKVTRDPTNPYADDIAANTLHVARIFAEWLETGERK